jgi:HprK-related kinase B
MNTLASLVASFETLHVLRLQFADVPIRVRTNDAEIATRLARYYTPWVVGEAVRRGGGVVDLVQGEPVVDGDFQDLVRAGGRRVKEATRDGDDGRLILKRGTGVLMGLMPGRAFAVGDLRAHLNQGINLINAVYAKAVMRRGHLLFHASAVSWRGAAVALAGPPSAGKSTSALHCVGHGLRFLSNDRVLAKLRADGVEVVGYPKHPRVNPGTLLTHPRLAAFLSPDERAALEALPSDDLWRLERKRDVDLDAVYGPGAVDLRARLRAFVLLRWLRGERQMRVRLIEVSEALAALPLYYKDLGAFDLDREPGSAPDADVPRRYRALLRRVTLVEVTGAPDFPRLVKLVLDLLGR